MSHTKKLVLARDRVCQEAGRLRNQRDRIVGGKNAEGAKELSAIIQGLDRAVKIIENVMVNYQEGR